MADYVIKSISSCRGESRALDGLTQRGPLLNSSRSKIIIEHSITNFKLTINRIPSPRSSILPLEIDHFDQKSNLGY